MASLRPLLISAFCLAWGLAAPASAQEEAAPPVPCKDLPCTVSVDWNRSGGITSLQPDRRYGNPAELEELMKRRLASLGYERFNSTDDNVLKIVLVPQIRNAMCDQMAGTSTDMSCRAVTDIEARLEGPDAVREDIDLPSRIRNRCGSDQLMPIDRFATFVAEYIAWAVEGKSKGDRRPSSRC